MGKMKEYYDELCEDALTMDRGEWILKHGFQLLNHFEETNRDARHHAIMSQMDELARIEERDNANQCNNLGHDFDGSLS